MAMLKVLGTFLLGFAALAVLGWGWIVWLPLAVRLGTGRDPLWQLGAFVGLLAVEVAVAAGLWRLHDALTRRLDFRGPALPDRRYCQRCGAPQPDTEPASRVLPQARQAGAVSGCGAPQR